MTAKRDSGSWDDAYFDNVDLELRRGGSAAAVDDTPCSSAADRAAEPAAAAAGRRTVGGRRTISGHGSGERSAARRRSADRGQLDDRHDAGDRRVDERRTVRRTPDSELRGRRLQGHAAPSERGNAARAHRRKLRRLQRWRTAAKPKKKTIVRSLWGNGKGRFVTTGRFASATVRGTVWLTQDRCDGTRIFVKSGSVAVFDRKLRKTVTVTAGHSYSRIAESRALCPKVRSGRAAAVN